jgi:hypothetical protein
MSADPYGYEVQVNLDGSVDIVPIDVDAVTDRRLSDTAAMDLIAGVLSGEEWSADTAPAVADIVLMTGRVIDSPDDELEVLSDDDASLGDPERRRIDVPDACPNERANGWWCVLEFEHDGDHLDADGVRWGRLDRLPDGVRGAIALSRLHLHEDDAS